MGGKTCLIIAKRAFNCGSLQVISFPNLILCVTMCEWIYGTLKHKSKLNLTPTTICLLGMPNLYFADFTSDTISWCSKGYCDKFLGNAKRATVICSLFSDAKRDHFTLDYYQCIGTQDTRSIDLTHQVQRHYPSNLPHPSR